jgi:glycosyltransferase involved in cell wall biosynthesis
MSDVSVVVPLYNEEQSVAMLQRELANALTGLDYEIIFVDDGSQDQTGARIAPNPRTRVLRFEKNVGQSAAIFAGLQAVRSEIAVLIDGDLQNDPADIPRLLAEISRGADLVCGYRAQRKDTLAETHHQPCREFCPEPFYAGWCSRHRLHLKGDATGLHRGADSIQGHAPFHSRIGERSGISAG